MLPTPSSTYGPDAFTNSLDAIISGEFSPDDVSTLNNALREDPQARRTYVQTMVFEAMLAREFAPPEKYADPAYTLWKRWITPAAVAATITLAATLAWNFNPSTLSSVGAIDSLADPDEEITHAVITSLDDASGHFRNTVLTQGLRLSDGVLELESGVAEITFDTGAEVTLEGPARLQLESDSKSLLTYGRAAAHVPEQARGFVIHTPSSYIRDLGTSFAVEVINHQETDLHVLDGEVEVAPSGDGVTYPTKILRQRQAVRLVSGTMLPINFKPYDASKRRRKRANQIPEAVHWSFDSWNENSTTDPSSGHILKLQQNKKSTVPDILEGPFGSALHFDGLGTFARSEYLGISGSQARTVACWIRLQPGDARPNDQANGIIAWGVNRSPAKWQLSWNRAQGQGNVGAPRVDFGNGFVIASTDLRDGQWHHLAIVCLGGAKGNIAGRIRIYVDGKLELITGRRKQRNKTDTSSTGERPLMIGRLQGQRFARESKFLEGDLDEIYIFEGSLLPRQIVCLMKRNTIHPEEP